MLSWSVTHGSTLRSLRSRVATTFPKVWRGEIRDGKLSLPRDLNSALSSRFVYVLGTASGYFIICPDELIDHKDRSGNCVPFHRHRNHESHVYGIGMTRLTEVGRLTFPKEIRDSIDFENTNIVLVERQGFIEIWSLSLWNFVTKCIRIKSGNDAG